MIPQQYVARVRLTPASLFLTHFVTFNKYQIDNVCPSNPVLFTLRKYPFKELKCAQILFSLLHKLLSQKES